MHSATTGDDIAEEHEFVKTTVAWEDLAGDGFYASEEQQDGWEAGKGEMEIEELAEREDLEEEQELDSEDSEDDQDPVDDRDKDYEDDGDDEDYEDDEDDEDYEDDEDDAEDLPESPIPSSPSGTSTPAAYNNPSPVSREDLEKIASSFRQNKLGKRKRSPTPSFEDVVLDCLDREHLQTNQGQPGDSKTKAPPVPTGNKCNEERPAIGMTRRQLRQKAKDEKKRAKGKETRGKGVDYILRLTLQRRFKDLREIKLSTRLGTNIKAANGSWQGLKGPQGEGKCPTLEELRKKNIPILEWDGSVPILLTDRDRRIIAVLVPPPKDSGTTGEVPWRETVRGAYEALERCCERLRWGDLESLPRPSGEVKENRRGDYETFNIGWSMGCGAKKPAELKHTKHNTAVLDEYRKNSHICRLIAFATSVMAFYFPKLFQDYSTIIKQLCQHPGGPGSNPPFPDGVFGAHSGNRGPAAYAHMHKDFLNLGFGICGVQSLGDFDYEKGGHMYFPQLGFATQFPPGCLILLPSAALIHGNVPVSKHEYRASLVHYTPAGLFRYTRYDFKTKTSIIDGFETDAEKAAWKRNDEAKNPARLARALGLFSTPESLFKDQEEVFGKQEPDTK